MEGCRQIKELMWDESMWHTHVNQLFLNHLNERSKSV